MMKHYPQQNLTTENLKLVLQNMLMTCSVLGIYCPAGLDDIEDVNRELTQGH